MLFIHVMLTHCGLVVTQIWINISSGNGLWPDGTKSLPEPMLTSSEVFCDILIHLETISQEVHMSIPYLFSLTTLLKLQTHLSGAKELPQWGWVMHICISKLTTISLLHNPKLVVAKILTTNFADFFL